ncbi:MAG: hypothetical protein HY268_07605 [Deltaproteobacteria bacterium]|nr:hypothetical protein [Deltaproteobacteria bacterium]
MAYGDPAIPLDDKYFALVSDLHNGQKKNQNLAELFQEYVFGWTAFLLAHEAGHILLNHGKILRERFPQLPSAVAQWPDDAKRLTQSFEMAADQFAVDLLTSTRKLSVRAISVWFQWQAVHYVAAVTQVGIDTDQLGTHPHPQKRFEAVLSQIAKLEDYRDLNLKEYVASFGQLIDKYDRALLAGQIDKLFPMRGRPASMTVKSERAMERATKLMFCTSQSTDAQQQGGPK